MSLIRWNQSKGYRYYFMFFRSSMKISHSFSDDFFLICTFSTFYVIFIIFFADYRKIFIVFRTFPPTLERLFSSSSVFPLATAFSHVRSCSSHFPHFLFSHFLIFSPIFLFEDSLSSIFLDYPQFSLISLVSSHNSLIFRYFSFFFLFASTWLCPICFSTLNEFAPHQ